MMRKVKIRKRIRKMTRVESLGDWQLRLFCTDSKKFYGDISRAKDAVESVLCLGNGIVAF